MAAASEDVVGVAGAFARGAGLQGAFEVGVEFLVDGGGHWGSWLDFGEVEGCFESVDC
jgi:hypothetical protein